MPVPAGYDPPVPNLYLFSKQQLQHNPARMKPKSSCLSCRHRHRKCITRPGATQCYGCAELDKDCDFGPNFQFCPSNQPLKATSSSRPRTSMVEHGQVADHEPDGEPAVYGQDADGAVDDGPITSRGTLDISYSPGVETHDLSDSTGVAPGCLSLPSPDIAFEDPSSQQQTECGSASTTSSSSGDATLAWVPAGSLDSVAPNSPETSFRSGLCRRDAYLFRIWTQRLSFISDGVDDARHFGVLLPRLALKRPVIFFGILALASRFDSLSEGRTSDLESTYYHGRCIELLIESFSQPAETYDEGLLAAVVISRLYEENDDTQGNKLVYHLNGAGTLLSSEVITRLAKDGGLAEAACWVHLRQSIYVAISQRRRLSTPLSVFSGLTAFWKNNDTSYANRAVYLLAKILLDFFPDEDQSSLSDMDNWASLEHGLDTWFDNKSSSFEPIYYEPPDIETGRPFPSMWMLSTTPTVALQYYFSGKIILCLKRYNESAAEGGFEAARLRNSTEKSMSEYLCILMGLALSNRSFLNAWYLPCHLLDLCGYCIRSSVERTHTLQYLETVKQEIQWNTAPVITALRRQWDELDGYDI